MVHHNKLTLISREDGFTLIESIAAVVLVSLTVGGLFLAWYFTETRDRRMQDYWKAKELVELSYQITQQTIRTHAKASTLSLNNDGEGILFTGTDNLVWNFTKDGSNYKLVHGGKEEILIHNICNDVNFFINEPMVTITLGVTVPPTWTGANDLKIQGEVYTRNP